jgi:hypothetical protein
VEREVKYEVGQSVYVVPAYGKPSAVTVEKVGRKWVSLSNHRRVGQGSDRLDNPSGVGAIAGTVYESEAAYQATVARLRAWERFRCAVERQWRPEPIPGVEAIAEAARLLGLKID